MVAWLLEQGHDARGIDQNPETVAAARRFLASRGCDAARITAAALDELVGVGTTVDNVVSMDCLEHIEDDRRAFTQLTALLEPGGRLVVTVPALPAVFSRRDEDMGHYRRYVPDTLRELATGLPLRIDEVRYWNLLGVAPTFLSARILRRRMSESFRYGGDGLRRRALRAALSSWFQNVENRIRPPLGLTLILTATRS
jgi:SAM-dependent methyltransferase